MPRLKRLYATTSIRGDNRRLNVLALALVVTLLGSVLIPAQLTWRNMGRLDRITAVDPRVARALEDIRVLEETSLVVNAGLVIVALAAVMSVVALARRERRLAAIVRRRLAHEFALRQAAESLAQAFTIEEVTEQIVDAAVQSSVARGAFVEHIVPETRDSPTLAVVQATAGPAMPMRGEQQPYASSHAQRAIDRGEPILVDDLSLSFKSVNHTGRASAIVVPLHHTTAPIGALFLVNSQRDRDDSLTLAAAYTFGKLATLAYEKVRLLEEAREGRRQLERAMKGRSRLMRGFSHDVKNPLGAADGFAELLALGIKGDLTLEQRETIAHIRRCIKTALSLITDLHQLGRAETGNIVLDKTTVDLTDLVRAIGEDYEGAARAKGLSLDLDLPLDPLFVDTDRVRVREIVGNLLSNAIKYTAAGSVTLRLGVARLANDEQEHVHIAVSDTGPGVPAEKHELIFEEFSRLSTEEGGAGLGLAISKLLADALGGRIFLVSQPGAGSTFSLWLPLETTEGAAETALQLQTTS